MGQFIWVWLPGIDKLEDGEELQCDLSVYNSLHGFHVRWPSLRVFLKGCPEFLSRSSSASVIDCFYKRFELFRIWGCKICSQRLKILAPIALLAWAVLVPVNWTNDTLELVKQLRNVTASDIDKLSISNIPEYSTF